MSYGSGDSGRLYDSASGRQKNDPNPEYKSLFDTPKTEEKELGIPEISEVMTPTPNLEVIFTHVFTWKIESWSECSQSSRLYSDEFEAGGHKWRILLFPKGNTVGGSISCFLDSLDSHEQDKDSDWHMCVHFTLLMANPNNPGVYFHEMGAKHRFTPKENDWGFNTFVKLSFALGQDISSPKGFKLIENDKTLIVAYLIGYADTNGVLWHKFDGWSSKKRTGYVGLKNQGATCYMNSLLQALYFTPIFCRATFQIPTENDNPSESVALALQRLFYNLKTSSETVSTHELTKSFGWDANDSYLQHDVQEFNRVLQDSLEKRMKGTPAENAISKLFVGKMKSLIKCLRVPYESSRVEDFYDIQLNVKGCKNIIESFDQYVKMEILENENRYQAEGFGLQDAKKGVVFESFPPILHLHLKRFEYDFNANSMVKINDWYKFSLELDLSTYLENYDETKCSGDEKKNLYHLHGVLVHNGDLNCGHYCTFLRPGFESKWFKFDDEIVTPVMEHEAIDENFGDPSVNDGRNKKKDNLYSKCYKRFTNAYMLIYLRDADRPEILKPLEMDDIPEHLKTSIERDKSRFERTNSDEIQPSNTNYTVQVITDDCIRNNYSSDLIPNRNNKSHLRSVFKFNRSDTFSNVVSKIAIELKVPPTALQIWISDNNSRRIKFGIILTEELKNQEISQIVNFYKINCDPDIMVYAKIISGNGHMKCEEQVSPDDAMLIFLKYYDQILKMPIYIGSIVIDRRINFEELSKELKTSANISPSTNILVYCENPVEMSKFEFIHDTKDLQSGDILFFEELGDYNEFKIISYFDNLGDSVCLTLKSRGSDLPHDIIVLIVPADETSDSIATKLAWKINCMERAPLIRLWDASMSSTAAVIPGAANFPVRFCDDNIATLTYSYGKSNYSNLRSGDSMNYANLEYDIIEASPEILKKQRVMTVNYVNRNLKHCGTYDVILDKSGTVYDLIHKLFETIPLECDGNGLFRILELYNFQINRVLYPSEFIEEISDRAQLYLEEIPDEELKIQVAYSQSVFNTDIYNKIEDESQRSEYQRSASLAYQKGTQELDPYACRNYSPVNPERSEPFVVNCINYSDDTIKANAIPFRFTIFPGEVFKKTKVRLKKRMGLTDKYFPKVRFSICTKQQNLIAPQITDSTILSDYNWTGLEVLECEHISRTLYRGNRLTNDKAVKIMG